MVQARVTLYVFRYGTIALVHGHDRAADRGHGAGIGAVGAVQHDTAPAVFREGVARLGFPACAGAGTH